LRPLVGLDGRDYLTGVRLDGELSQRLGWDAGAVGFKLGGRLYAIGAQLVAPAPRSFAVCSPRCAEIQYRIPLSYAAPWAGVDLRVDFTKRLALKPGVRLEWRRYLEDSALEGLSSTSKRRQDLRLRPNVNLELALDQRARWLAIGGYEFLFSRSNVAFDAANPEHAADYDDREFEQHFVELGIQARF
jgi:hypothetical protein